MAVVTSCENQELPALKKAGLEVVFKNFRPISILPFVSKLSEREAADHLMRQHAVDQGLDGKFQSAYKKHHSTETALLKVKNDLLMNMDNQHVTLLVLLDLSAAFDTVSHDILPDRLNTRFGMSGTALLWLQSYLADRSQRVSINGVLSDRFELRHGVPQGSCLGPLLFSLYCILASCLTSQAPISQRYIVMLMTLSSICRFVPMQPLALMKRSLL